MAPLIATPSFAAGDDIVIPPISIPLLTQTSDPSFIQLSGTGSIEISVPTGEQVKPQCVTVPIGVETGLQSGLTTCIGAPSARDPLEDTGVGGLADFLPSESGDHVAALGWIVREAVDAVGLLYDVPADGRIERYAGDQIRGYIITRIIDILDRKLYSVPLTADEQATYDYITGIFLEVDRATARFAKEEYDRYMANECGYNPPAAPAYVTDPVLLPESVRGWCLRLQSQLEQVLAYAPPIPSAENFQAWGAYRNAEALGLNTLGNESLRQNLVDAQSGLNQIGAIGGLASAVGAGVVAGTIAGSSSAVSGAIVSAIGSQAAFTTLGGGTLGSVSAVGAVAAAGVVAVIVVAIIGITVSSIQVAERAAVGTRVNNRLANLLATDDPFGITESSFEYIGLGLREGLDPDNPPRYRSEDAIARILSTVVEKTSARYGGVFLPDAEALWPDNETTPQDFRFRVSDSDGTRVVDEITIPIQGTATTARFSRGWVIADGGSGEQAALSFPLVTPAGEAATVTRNAFSGSGFTVTRISSNGTAITENVDQLEYLDAEGGLVQVELVPESTSGLAGPTPSAVGPLTPGRTVILRPNPVALDGSFDLDRFLTGYDYEWTVVRDDPQAGTRVTVVPPTIGYDARFIPQTIGSYRASVRMVDTDDSDGTDADVWGSVDFAIIPPAVEVSELTLTDDGISELRIEAQLTAEVPSNEYTLSVTWPGSVDGDAPVTRSLTLPCIQVDAVECSTVRTALFSEFNDVLAYSLPLDADLAQGVTVTITDRFGGGTTRTFPINDASRPGFAAPDIDPSPTQPGFVDFSPVMTTLQVPVGYVADPNYEVARIRPGSGLASNFGLVDPLTNLPATSIELPGGGARARIVYDADLDEWAVSVRVTANATQVGTTVVPLIVQQVTGARSTLPLTLELVPASGDRFRGAVSSSVDPNNFSVPALPTIVPYVMGGKAEWEDYDSDVCVSVRFTEFPTPAVERCSPIAELLDGNGEFAPIDFRDFAPNGVRAGRYEVAVRIEAGERADETPFLTTFRTLYNPPSITAITYDAETGAVTVDAEPSDPAVPIASIECRLDGTTVGCDDAANGSWPAEGLLPGPRTFSVEVIDGGGNYSFASQQFTVAEPVDPTDPTDPIDPTDPTDPEVPIVIDPETPEEPAVTLSSRRPAAGDRLVVEGSGFGAGASVRIELQSEPVVLANARANASGDFRALVTVPRSTPPGPHDIVVINTVTGAEQRIAITVLPAPGLASTGAGDVGGALALALLFLLFGFGIAAVRGRTVRP